MSRSRRQMPVCGRAGSGSDAAGKAEANRRLRRESRRIVASDGSPPLFREVSNVWAMPKDGKMRFDPIRHPHLMRK